MKKIFMFCTLLMLVCIGANAATLNEDVRFSMTLTSFDAVGNKGGTLKFVVLNDFSGTLYLPTEEEQVYSNKVQIDVAMQKIPAFGIDTERSYTKVLTTNQSESKCLYDYLENCYEFNTYYPGKEKYITVKCDGLETTFKVSKSNTKKYIVKIQPDDCDKAKAVWDALTSHISHETLTEDDSYFTIAKKSSITNGNEHLTFVDDCTLQNDKNLKGSMENFQNSINLTTAIDMNYIQTVFAPGSVLRMGMTQLTLDDYFTITVDAVSKGFLSQVKSNVNKNLKENTGSELKKQFINDALLWLKKLDADFVNPDPMTIEFNFNQADVYVPAQHIENEEEINSVKNAIPANVTSIDLRQAETEPEPVADIIKYAKDLNPNVIVYVPEGGISKKTNTSNVVLDGTCNHFEIKDVEGFHSINVPTPFTAKEAKFSRKMNDQYWATICLPFEANVDNAYVVESLTDDVLTVTKVEGKLAANTPAFVKNFTGAVYATDVAISTKPAETTTDDVTLSGCYFDTPIEGDNYYYISNNKFVRANEKVAVKPFRAYFTTTTTSPAKAIAISDADAITAIDALTGEGNVTVVGIYDANGKMYSDLQSGLNIVKMSNGKVQKIMVK